MSKIDIISGFLGAGKTTLIKKLIAEAYQNEKIVLIENEFGEIGIDGTFLKDSGVTINEMNSGCICCSLVGDFETSLKEVLDTYHPDRVIIEPSGVGKLSDVIKAVSTINSDEMELDNFITVVDAKKCRMYTKNFGEFYNNQVEHASLIVLSRSQDLTEFQLKECLDILKGLNDHSPIITTAWDKLNGLDIINACEVNIQEELLHEHDHECCGHNHHEHDHHEHDHDHECCGHDHHEHDHECGCGHDHHEHDHDHECCGHDHHEHDHECGCGHDHEEHHHHDHDHECGCGHDHEEHEHHHHDHDHECGCGHDHHDHHHHHADEVFTSWGRETIKKYTREGLEKMLEALSASEDYGIILRAKGMLPAEDGTWIYFDMVPEETEIREGAPEYTGRLCVIGSKLKEDKLAELFGLA